MAKKKAPDASKKNEQKKKKKLIEDKTFGLKNKNKSKKVQELVNSVTKAVLHSGVNTRQRVLEEQRKKQKVEAKERRKEEKNEQDALFGAALLAIGKSKSTNQKEGKTEALGRDGNEETAKKGTSRAMKMMFQMDAQEMEERLKEDVSSLVSLCFACDFDREK
jgi:hypothetical protein